jgi:S-adenosylmethionine synthetase
MVAAGISDEVLVQVAYAIGIAKPVGLYVNTYGKSRIKIDDGEIARRIANIFDLRPAIIIKRLGLKNPIFFQTAAYGHMGRKPYSGKVTIIQDQLTEMKDVEFFAWEKLDYVDKIKKEFGL